MWGCEGGCVECVQAHIITLAMGPRLRTLGVLAALLVLCTVAGARSTVFDDDEEESTARSDQHVATVLLEHAFGVRMSKRAPRASAACCCRRRLQCCVRPPAELRLPPAPTGRPAPSFPAIAGPLLKSVPPARARPVRGPPPVLAGGCIQSTGFADLHGAQAGDDQVQAASQRADRAEQALQR